MTDHIHTDNSQVIVNAHKLQDAIDKALADYAKGKDIHVIMKELKETRAKLLGSSVEQD